MNCKFGMTLLPRISMYEVLPLRYHVSCNETNSATKELKTNIQKHHYFCVVAFDKPNTCQKYLRWKIVVIRFQNAEKDQNLTRSDFELMPLLLKRSKNQFSKSVF